MDIPNTLFYDGKIKCGYLPNNEKMFMYSDTPFLFIDVPKGKEKKKGPSFENQDEAKVINLLKNFVLE